ncbi:zinc finger Ran-binding domain-containing protein 2 [Aethina tumida]|uniref:zinc finger Ran-binding domain-containing protein 2 n=1 Tax=Aethina tumida TaxID=116153 RepID=UPI00096B4915|nr:zinc finger Ran-binding domain-containing protein 2 [Aethina tumida]XP_049823280.1 zinc finger Ran-binding domain-containing protein 2 [Aethina tumida]
MAEADLTPPPPPCIKSPSGSNSQLDWTCEECGNVNFARRNSCNRCFKTRGANPNKKRKLGTEIGKAAAEKSRGLFSADDWQCNKCGNVNWARRQQCNVCNAPKFGEVEERTGFGGGYNDRGVVEYKEREESDDEYDEFGRRKKKLKNNEKGGSHYSDEEEEKEVKTNNDSAKGEEEAEEEEEEDDEEDDDDGDLSKYDLSDWGDVGGDSKDNNRSHSPHDRSKH